MESNTEIVQGGQGRDAKEVFRSALITCVCLVLIGVLVLIIIALTARHV